MSVEVFRVYRMRCEACGCWVSAMHADRKATAMIEHWQFAHAPTRPLVRGEE